jgi:DNA-binding GntR family transcriptional regulator
MIEGSILSGRFAAGAKLRQQDLARQFGVGAGVVREALLELQSRGLVETRQNRGAYAVRIDRKSLFEAFEIREVHEGLAVRLCCRRVSRAQTAELRDLAHAIRALADEDLAASAACDRQFHERLLHIANHHTLIRLAKNDSVLSKVVHLGNIPRSELPPDLLCPADETLAEHLAILDAIDRGDEDDAEAQMRAHIRRGKEEAKKLIDAGLVLHWLA